MGRDPPAALEGAPSAERAAQALRRRAYELTVINRIATALNGSLDLADALAIALDHAAELLGLESGWIWLLDPQTGEPELAAARRLPPGLAEGSPHMRGSCYCLYSYAHGELSDAENIRSIGCSRLAALDRGGGGLHFHASVPLDAPQSRLGVMNLASASRTELSAEDLELLRTIGALLSIAIERARLQARRAEAARADERGRLARELHDTIAQGLAAIALQLEALDLTLEQKLPAEQELREPVQRVTELARSTLAEARRSVEDLRAPLSEGGLRTALGRLATELATELPGGAPVVARLADPLPTLPLRVELAIYRTAQEALRNALRHARASRIELVVEVPSSTGALELVVRDDGCGFDSADVPAGRFGLRGLHERARAAGGVLTVESEPGAGTTLRLRIPLPEPAGAGERTAP